METHASSLPRREPGPASLSLGSSEGPAEQGVVGQDPEFSPKSLSPDTVLTVTAANSVLRFGAIVIRQISILKFCT